METMSAWLAAIEDLVNKFMKVAILISSFLDSTYHNAVSACIKAMNNKDLTLEYVRMISLKNCKGKILKDTG